MTACRIEDPLPSRDHREENHIPRLFFLRLEPFLYEFTFNMTTGSATQSNSTITLLGSRDATIWYSEKSQWAYLPRIAKEKYIDV